MDVRHNVLQLIRFTNLIRADTGGQSEGRMHSEITHTRISNVRHEIEVHSATAKDLVYQKTASKGRQRQQVLPLTTHELDCRET